MSELNARLNAPEVDVIIKEPQWQHYFPRPETLIQRVIALTLKTAGWNYPTEVSIVLSNDEEMISLNHTYRGYNQSTNVLSFAHHTARELQDLKNKHLPILLGDVVLAFETIEHEAQNQDKTFHSHFLHLLIHGVLHLLGHDHKKFQEAEKMEALEVTILKELDVSNPYQGAY